MACALLIERGVGVHHEFTIKGNGERGSTSLQEALAPSHWGADAERALGKREVARLLIEDGATYDVYSACALDDTERLQALIDEDADIARAAEDFGMTPLHWAAAGGVQGGRAYAAGDGRVPQRAQQEPTRPAASGRRTKPG